MNTTFNRNYKKGNCCVCVFWQRKKQLQLNVHAHLYRINVYVNLCTQTKIVFYKTTYNMITRYVSQTKNG